MQGRLVPPIDGQIQNFPADLWRDELALCAQAGFDGVEWIHTKEPDPRNPIAQAGGASIIADVCRAAGSRVLSCTYDAMLTPRALDEDPGGPSWRRHLGAIEVMAGNLRALGASHLVLPWLADNRIHSDGDRTRAIQFVRRALEVTAASRIELHLETSLRSAELLHMLDEIDDPRCRVTFDTGNMVQFGYAWHDELSRQWPRVGSVHLKDATSSGTVPLGTGEVDFRRVAATLVERGHRGDCVIQGARVTGASDFETSRGYLDFFRSMLNDYH